MGLLRWPLRRSRDPYWDAFVNRPLADPANVITDAIRHAPEGRIFPVRSELPEPDRLIQDLDQLIRFLGGSAMGVTRTETAFLRPGDGSTPDESPDPAEVAADHPFTIVCAVHAEHHPDKAKGMAGQHVLHESASVNFSLAAYIRELGYRATVRPVDSAAAARAAGLEPQRSEYVGDAVVTDLPLSFGHPHS